MSNPLFRVGEKVGLVSKNYPERNGVYTVREVIPRGASFVCRLTGEQYKRYDLGFGYILEESCLAGAGINHEKPWNESALRKIYPTSKYSFEDLLSEIKQCNMNTIEQ